MWWQPDKFQDKIHFLQARERVIDSVRGFFKQRGYLEVDTPALQIAPCMEPHIQAFKTEYVAPDGKQKQKFYLHTSPEFAMKKLLVAGLPKIFQLAKVFRNNEGSRWHSPEFTMLEWYQSGLSYGGMMQETLDLLRAASPQGAYRRGDMTCDPRKAAEIITVVDAVKKYADVDIADHLNNLDHIRAQAKRIGVHVSKKDDWDNALLKILMDKVEPHLGQGHPTIICDYPVSMAALSRPKPSDPRFAERFELYVCGIELANAFGELTDAAEQRRRFHHDVMLRKKIYGDSYPVDEDFLRAIEYGLPECTGNALGIDRLVMLATGAQSIEQVQAAPVV
jgi:lysyl-tRNA synthetase class 2